MIFFRSFSILINGLSKSLIMCLNLSKYQIDINKMRKITKKGKIWLPKNSSIYGIYKWDYLDLCASLKRGLSLSLSVQWSS